MIHRALLLVLLGLLWLVQPVEADQGVTVPDLSDRDLFERALAASRDGAAAQALSLWDRYLERQPQDAAAWSNRGNVRLVLGDPEAAIADQTQALALEPEAIDPHLNRSGGRMRPRTTPGSWSGIPRRLRPSTTWAMCAALKATGRRPLSCMPRRPWRGRGLRWHAPARLWPVISLVSWMLPKRSCAN